MSPHAAAAGVDLDAEQTAAIDAPRAGGTVAITGTAGTGKTFTLVRRALRLAADSRLGSERRRRRSFACVAARS
jgi:ATP-dependent exoDNAse (exonuclease V) beta subunit